MKLAFQVMLCLKLGDGTWDLPTYYLLLPIWLWLPVTILDLIHILCTKRHYSYNTTLQHNRGRNNSDWN